MAEEEESSSVLVFGIYLMVIVVGFFAGGHIDNSPTSVIYPGDCPPNSGRSNPIRTTTSVHAAKSAVMEKQPLVYPNDGLTFRSIRDRLASLDLYPKTLEDFRIKTLGGATVTFLSCSIIAILFLLELNYYLTPYVHEELMIDISSGQKLRISFDITFPHVGCSHLSLDATDISGEQHINIAHNIFKRRLDDHGSPIEQPKKDNTIVTKKSKIVSGNVSIEETKNEVALDPNRCDSCYGAKGGCCNTCQEVRNAYNTKGWAWNPAAIEQCRREGITDDGSQSKEGCQVFGTLEVNKISGNFHLALGQSFEKHHVHVHDINLSELLTVNTSHTINHLSFGQKLDNTVNQLDGVSYISDEGRGLAIFQYYIKIIPTIFQSLDGEEIQTNQFSVTRYKKDFGSTFDAMTEGRLPGVFFIYEFAPMMVKYSEKSRSFLHFLTTLCGIVGGILTVAGIVDSLIYHSVRVLRAKMQIGKLT